MSDNSQCDKEQNYILSLDTLPVEVFLHICSFLNAKTILSSLRLVCKRLYDILSDEIVWRTWIKQRWPSLKVPVLEFTCLDGDLDVKDICYHVDEEMQLWAGDLSNMKKHVWKDVHFATVDTVKLLNKGKIAVSGSRDRSLAVWDVNNESATPLDHSHTAHSGWIWSLASHEDNSFYSCSWDSTVKLWDIQPQLREVTVFKCTAAALSLGCQPGLVASGLFSACVIMFDPRQGGEPVNSYTAHKLAVTALVLAGDYIVSGSEDKSICVWDLRMGQVYKSAIQVCNKNNSFPMSLSFRHNLLYVGDNQGCMHLLNTKDASFEMRESYEVGHKPQGKVTTLWHDLGCVMTGSTDKTIRIHTPTSPPTLIAELHTDGGEVTDIDYSNSVLAVACTDNAVEVWMPNGN